MSHSISDKTLQDLEFNTILQQVANHCISNLSKEVVLEITPFKQKEDLFRELNLVNEFTSSFVSENKIPSHYFEDITREIKTLNIENSYIDPESFLRLSKTSETVNELKLFLKKFKDYFPTLNVLSEDIFFTTEIITHVNKIITPFNDVANNASFTLLSIRKEISSVKAKVGESFNHALSACSSNGFLDDIRESVIDNQRVLAVSAMYRKKVKGSLLGTSKTGTIVYIAPQATLQYNRVLQNLYYEEKQEIIDILKELANQLRPFVTLFKKYLQFLIHIDCISAKAKYAHQINGLLPTFSSKKKVLFKNAYHPILWLKNKGNDVITIPQDISLHENQQIIVISGPNAGGKSITLKTIGLLQVMLQSGMLIPVDEHSETYFFDTILTDIGDNQSIENQLSTYSYRLKNMRHFLKKCNKNTLFLIDEFGTGSDPELGGALAEIFLEEFYSKEAFGIITTHYANLKVLADELDNVVNANMQFNERTLEPLYKLFIGQAGSSFTFEVAQKNGIPFNIINRAKKRVETEKIRLDKTISKLQKERNRLQRSSENLEKQQSEELEQIHVLQNKELKIQEKLEGFQELYDSNQRMLSIGRKINDLINPYFQTNNKKEMVTHFVKWALIERTKYVKKNPVLIKTKAEKKETKEKEIQRKKIIQKVESEVLQKVVEVRKVKQKVAEKIAKEKADYLFKVNDRVRLIDGNAVGSIDKIEKKNVFINYGIFTTKASFDKIELVEKAK